MQSIFSFSFFLSSSSSWEQNGEQSHSRNDICSISSVAIRRSTRLRLHKMNINSLKRILTCGFQIWMQIFLHHVTVKYSKVKLTLSLIKHRPWKDGRCVQLTTLPPSCAECLEIWEPQIPGTLRAYPGLYRDCFTFTTILLLLLLLLPLQYFLFSPRMLLMFHAIPL